MIDPGQTDLEQLDLYIREEGEKAAQAHDAEVEALGSMTPEELDYLARVGELEDEETYLECDHESRLEDDDGG